MDGSGLRVHGHPRRSRRRRSGVSAEGKQGAEIKSGFADYLLYADGRAGLQAALKRAIALENRARRRAGRGLTERVDTWMTDRLAWARFYWET